MPCISMCIAGFTRKFERSAGANAAKRSRELFLRFEIQHPDFIPTETHRDCARCDVKIPLSMRNPQYWFKHLLGPNRTVHNSGRSRKARHSARLYDSAP